MLSEIMNQKKSSVTPMTSARLYLISIKEAFEREIRLNQAGFCSVRLLM